MPEPRDELGQRSGVYVLLAVWLAAVLPCVATPWLALRYFGPFYAILTVIAAHFVWYLLAGPPMAASGSKPSSCGWSLIMVATWPALIMGVILLASQLS